MKNLSIIYVTGCSLNINNAITVHITEIVDNLAKDHNILLFVPKEKEFNLKKTKVHIQYIPILGKGIIRFICYEILLFIYLFAYFIKLKHDIIYARSKIGIASLLVSLLFNTPRVVEVNGLYIEEAKMRNESAIRIFIITKILERFNYKFSTKIVAVTKNLKEKIKEIYHIPDEKIVVIENGANTDLFKPMSREKCIKELNLDESYYYVCFVGNLAPWQGVEYLIEAAPLILKKIPNTKFLIVGDGIMKEKLVKLAEKNGVTDKVIFTGAVPYEEVPKYINASDVCIVYKKPLASGYSPLKLYEYMSCAKPVVASRVTGFGILEKENAGVLVKPEDPEELVKAIVGLLKNERLRKRMGKNGRRYVVKNHSWKIVTQKIIKVIKEIVSS